MRINKSPNNVLLEKLNSLPARITKAPVKPSANPKTFCHVAFSCDRKNEITKTKMGVIIIMSAALMGVVMLSPAKNISWLMTTPNIPQTISIIKSFFPIFSFSQKR